jgi:FAD/FMN-containing dehydrogenase
MTSSLGLLGYPDVPAVPEPLRGRYLAHVRVAYTGHAADGDRLVAPLRAVGPTVTDTLADMPYTETGSIYSDPTVPHGYYGTNVMLDRLDAPAVQAVLDLAGPDAPAPYVVDLRHLGGALAAPPAVASAVGHRGAGYLLRLVSRLGSSDADAVRLAHQRVYEALQPWSSGGRSLSFMYGETTADQIRSGYDPDDYRRLTELKAVYDPNNVFRLNHNIPPATRPAAPPSL